MVGAPAPQARQAEVPDVVMITGPQRRGKGDEARAAAELFIAGELLAKDPREILHTLLHEAAHALAHAEGSRTPPGRAGTTTASSPSSPSNWA